MRMRKLQEVHWIYWSIGRLHKGLDVETLIYERFTD